MQGSTSGPVSIAVNGEDGFTGSVLVSLAGLPAGVVSNPASPFSVAAGASVSVFFGVTPGAATGNFTVTAQGASGSLSHSATLAITVQSSLGYSSQVYANPAFNGQPSPYKFVLYDQQRQFLYFSAPGSIDVFDLQASTFKPYTLALYCPSFKSPGPCPDDDVRGLALTPDGSQLFAADFGSQNIYLLNPDTPAIPAEVVPVAASGYNPARLAATKAQSLFVAFSGAATSSGMCTACLSEINLSASPPALQQPPQSVLSGLAASPVVEGDALGDRVFFSYATSPGGPFGFWDAALGTFTLSSANETTNDLAAAADGTRFVTVPGGVIEVHAADSNLTLLNAFVPPAEQLSARTPVPGIAMHPSGALVYQPFLTGPAQPPPQPGVPFTGPQAGIDIFDAHSGLLRLRVLLTEPLAATSGDIDALHASFITVDENGQRIFALTTSGLTIVQLTSVPLGTGTLSPASGPAAGGTSVTIRGSGFQSGTTATIGGNKVAVNLKDMNTLTFVTPKMTAGPQQFVLANPDGETTSLDAAFTAN